MQLNCRVIHNGSEIVGIICLLFGCTYKNKTNSLVAHEKSKLLDSISAQENLALKKIEHRFDDSNVVYLKAKSYIDSHKIPPIQEVEISQKNYSSTKLNTYYFQNHSVSFQLVNEKLFIYFNKKKVCISNLKYLNNRNEFCDLNSPRSIKYYRIHGSEYFLINLNIDQCNGTNCSTNGSLVYDLKNEQYCIVGGYQSLYTWDLYRFSNSSRFSIACGSEIYSHYKNGNLFLFTLYELSYENKFLPVFNKNGEVAKLRLDMKDSVTLYIDKKDWIEDF